MSLSLPTKQQITSSLSRKDSTWMFWRRNWVLRVHMYLLSWRRTNFTLISNYSHCSTTILSKHMTSALTAVQDGVIKYSKLSLAIVMWILVHQKLFWGHRNVAAAKLSGFSSIFLLYTHPYHIILSKQKGCLLWNGVSTESENLTSVRQIRRDFSRTRNMTLIHVGLALRYVKPLLSS